MAKQYNPHTRVEVRRMFVQECLSAKAIARHFKNRPATNTITNWSQEKDEFGKTWEDERKEYEQQQYELISPKGIAAKILTQIGAILNKHDFNTKDADSLAKLQASLQKLTDPSYQIPIMYSMLTDFLNFLKASYPGMVNQDIIDVFREFKSHLLKRLT